MTTFHDRIRPAVQAELDAARTAEARGDAAPAFEHLERAHVLGQSSTRLHVRAHWLMLRWAIRQRRGREVLGQLLRIVGAASKTAWGGVPVDNTGGSRTSPFRSMPIAPELQRLLDAARSPGSAS